MGPVLLTRPLADSRRLAEALEDDGIDCLIWPLTEIRPVEPEEGFPLGVRGLLVTSAHGIRAFAALDKRRDLPVLCVGDRTAEVARGLGFGMVLSANGDAEALARLAPGTGIRHFLYPRGRETAHDLTAMLAPGGQKVTEAVVYEAAPAGPPSAPVASALNRGALGAVTIWSRRNGQLFADWIAEHGLTKLTRVPLVAISKNAAEPFENAGFCQIVIADRPDAASMMQAILDSVDSTAP
ncbi:uroporphyrinogen-III synthase [Rhodobacteraceae bacterium NNCM2]|nr:uroporphyrinogen-III synthase [Coraliihabitans acroporae]